MKSESDVKPPDDENSLEWKLLIFKTLRAAVLFLLFYIVLALLFRKQLALAGIWLGNTLGYGGVFLYTYVVDTIIVPATADVVFPFALDWNPYVLLPIMSAASMLGGISGYWIARSFNHFGYVHRVTRSYRERGEGLIRKYGAWAVVIAGLTPVPYSTVCWIAGLLKVPAKSVFYAGFSRLPRMIIYYLLIRGGFSLAERFAV